MSDTVSVCLILAVLATVVLCPVVGAFIYHRGWHRLPIIPTKSPKVEPRPEASSARIVRGPSVRA